MARATAGPASLAGPPLGHHASLSIAAYAFLMAERLIADKPVGG
tara:strand:+ start:2527 stop:2658 length:132 start_codon:yes stop_codon:yes gene_type:complete